MAQKKQRTPYLKGASIEPEAVRGDMTAADLIDTAFLAYNGRRLREACRLFAEKMLAPDTVVGMSVTGALTPAGLGMSCLIPLIENGFVDWMVSTGANLYHDTHFGLGLKMFQGSAEADDVALRKAGRRAHLRHFFRLPRAALDRRFLPRTRAQRGVPASDGHGGVSLSRRPLCRRARAHAQAARADRCWRRRTSMRCRSTPRRPAILRSG